MPILAAIVPPGLEPVVARELHDHGHAPRIEPGHVQVKVQSPADAARLALTLHTPSRLLLQLAHSQASTLDQLARRTRSVDWTPFLHRRLPVRVTVVAKGSRIRRKEAAAKKVENAIADALRKGRSPARPGSRPVDQHVRVRLDGSQCTVSIDVGGDLLHKRGWRQKATKAPLRETLAASLLVLAGWEGDEPLLDPFCGAGTFAVEAGLLASGRSPYVGRTLACQAWPAVGSVSLPSARPLSAPLFASDHDPRAVEITIENARRAGIPVAVHHRDVADLEAPAPHGLVIANPPYGARLGRSEQSVSGVYKALGRALRGPLSGWRALFLAPSDALARTVDRRAFAITSFSNGSRTVTAFGLDPAESGAEV